MRLGTGLSVVSDILSPCTVIVGGRAGGVGGSGEFHAIGKISDVTEKHYAYHTDTSFTSATERPPLI